jgi:hypothetical protein
MRTRLFTLFFLALTLCRGTAEDFTPPQAYPVSRYEAGWQKNPFTLKTAPPAVQKESFAKDLVLGSVYKIGDSTKVVVVNTKTRARTPLLDDIADPSGMKVKSVHLENTTKETYAELELGADSAVVRYDEAFQKQMAAQQMQQMPQGMRPGVPSPAGPGNMPMPQPIPMPGAPVVSPGSGGMPNNYSNRPGMPVPANGGSNALIPTPQRRRLGTAPIPGQSH